MKNDLISVIIPVYNSEKTINMGLDSIINQSYKNIEIIIINDGSIDKSLSKIKEYKDKRIRLYNIKNHGAGYARNIGLKHAKGDYILYVDSDDYISCDTVKKLYELIIKYDADISVSAFIKNKIKIESVFDKKEAFLNLISYPEVFKICVVGKLFKRSIIKDIRFDINNHFEDIEYTTKVFLKANKVAYTPDIFYFINKRDNSWSSFYKGLDRIEACQKSWKDIEDNLLYGNYVTYSLFNAIAIINKMIIYDDYDKEILCYVKRVVKENISYVKNSIYPFKKKLQIYIFNYCFSLYKIIYSLLMR